MQIKPAQMGGEGGKMADFSTQNRQNRVTVVLGVANPLMLAAMSEIFEKDARFSLVATAATAEGFLGTVMRMPVKVGVIDWALPVLGGARLVEVLRVQANPPRIVVYAEDTGDIPRKAMASGAAGFVARTETVDRLLETCTAVAKGQMVFPFLDIRSLKQDPIEQLSPRERTLLEALARGLTNRELSRELGISINTVKFHLSNLFEKLSVRNRAQAIAFFYANRAARGEG
jgi:two-component system nitrate/nitrite response regulator NarP